MTQLEIYWNDLTDEAKNRLSELYHDNIHLAPLAVIEVDNVQEITKVNSDIQYIQKVIDQQGNVKTSELELDSSPIINSISDGNICELVEGINLDGVDTIVYDNGREIDYDFYYYDDLNPDLISEIRMIVENYEIDCEKTEKRISN